MTQILVESVGGRIQKVPIRHPLHPLHNETIMGSIGWLDDSRCVIESATAVGIELVAETERNPIRTTSFGLGQLVEHAFNEGAREIIVGTGDTSTVDCGVGLASALGVQFLDAFDMPVPPVGGFLGDIRRIIVSPLAELIAREASLEVACNPTSILGTSECMSRVYSPQKGADGDDLETIVAGVESFTTLMEEQLSTMLKGIPGLGGGGGIAGMLYALLGANIKFSFDVLRSYLDLDCKLADCDLVITCEGVLDRRSISGKLPGNIALYAKKYNKPVVVIAGGVADDSDLYYYNGIDAIELSAPRPCTLEEAIASVEQWIPIAANRLMHKLTISSRSESPPNRRPRTINRGSNVDNSTVKLVIMDLWNTLIKVPQSVNPYPRIVRLFGLTNENQFRDIMRANWMTRNDIDEEGFFEVLLKMGIPNARYPVSAEHKSTFLTIWGDYLRHVQILPNTFESIEELADSGLRIAIVTNTVNPSLQVVEELGLGGAVDLITSSCHTGFLKPDPRIFMAVLDHFGLNPEEAVVVGDKLRTDILGGLILGMKAIQLNPYAQHIDLKARTPILGITPSLTHLKTLIER